MTTREFIEKKLQGQTKKDYCNSVVSYTMNGQTTIYSYGMHYPLVAIIDGKAFVNNRGYSNTTSKHIGHAQVAAANIVGWVSVYTVELTNGNSLTKSGITESVLRQIMEITTAMDGKRRKDTQVFAHLERQLQNAKETLTAVKEIA